MCASTRAGPTGPPRAPGGLSGLGAGPPSEGHRSPTQDPEEPNIEVQQNIVALRPIRGEMFIERATVERFSSLPPGEGNGREGTLRQIPPHRQRVDMASL